MRSTFFHGLYNVTGDEIVLAMEERSLMADIEDYSEPTANRGHDPPSRAKGGGGNGHGRGRRRGQMD